MKRVNNKNANKELNGIKNPNENKKLNSVKEPYTEEETIRIFSEIIINIILKEMNNTTEDDENDIRVTS